MLNFKLFFRPFYYIFAEKSFYIFRTYVIINITSLTERNGSMLEIKNLSFNVNSGEKEIIKNISLKIPDGKLIVVTGPNGGGKSTLAKLIA